MSSVILFLVIVGGLIDAFNSPPSDVSANVSLEYWDTASRPFSPYLFLAARAAFEAGAFS